MEPLLRRPKCLRSQLDAFVQRSGRPPMRTRGVIVTAAHNNDDRIPAEKFNNLSTLVTETAPAPMTGLQATGAC
ncbi:hypothetical protein MTO96_036172 [Rhipicephalus appendiculatus]